MRKRVYRAIKRGDEALHSDKNSGRGNDRRKDKIATDAFVGPMAKHFRSYRDRLKPKG
jgi:hypothetical protein